MGTDPGTGDRESGGTPTPERCRGDQEAQGPACCRESAIGGGQEGECAKDRGVCKQRYTCACVHTHAHTHTVIHSQPETQMWNQADPVNHSALVPRTREEDRRERQSGQREALTPGSPGTSHSQRQKCRGAEAVASEL